MIINILIYCYSLATISSFFHFLFRFPMAKIDFRTLSRGEQEKIGKELWGALESAEREGCLLDFLHELLTPSERVMLGRRIRIAKHLLTGASLKETSKSLGVGLSTVRDVDKWLRKHCKEYKKMFAPLCDAVQRDVSSGENMSLKNRYPLVSLLFLLMMSDKR